MEFPPPQTEKTQKKNGLFFSKTLFFTTKKILCIKKFLVVKNMVFEKKKASFFGVFSVWGGIKKNNFLILFLFISTSNIVLKKKTIIGVNKFWIGR